LRFWIIILLCRLSYCKIFLFLYDPNLPKPSLLPQINTLVSYSIPLSLPISYSSNNKTPNTQGDLPFNYKNFFIADWRGQIIVPTSGIYNFSSGADDGWMLKLNGDTVEYNWDTSGFRSTNKPRNLTAGNYSFSLLTFQYTGNASVYFRISPSCILDGNVTINYKIFNYTLGVLAGTLKTTEIHNTYHTDIVYPWSVLPHWIGTLYPLHTEGPKLYEFLMESTVGTLRINYITLINNTEARFQSNTSTVNLIAGQPYLFEIFFVSNYPTPEIMWRYDNLTFHPIPREAFPDEAIYNGTLNTEDLFIQKDSNVVIEGDLIIDVLIVSASSNLTIKGNLQIDNALYLNPNDLPLINISNCLFGNGSIILDSIPLVNNITLLYFNDCVNLPNMSVIYPNLDKCIEMEYVYTKNTLQVAFRNICNFSITLPVILSVIGVVLLLIIIIAIMKHDEIKKEIEIIRGQMNHSNTV